MNLAEFMTIASGVAILATSIVLGLWQILSAPDRPNYPTSGRIKRTLMFWFMAALAYRGIEILTLAGKHPPVLSTEGQWVSSFLLLALFVTFLVDHVRNWLPAKTHARIRQLVRVARCGPRKDLIEARTSAMKNSTGAPCPAADVVGPALATLTLEGFKAVGPREGPEALQ